jgi:DNA-binding LacI/PurR family transcriptional regulator
LPSLGHRNFLVIGVEPPTPGADPELGGVVGARLGAYRAALRAAGIELPDDRVVVGPASIDDGAACFARAWEGGHGPTAVLAMSDAIAIEAIDAAAHIGLAVPADLSVVGFDDIELASYVRPPLTTVHQPIRRKGEEACRLLLGVIEQRVADESEVCRLETRPWSAAPADPAPRAGGDAGGG